MNDVWGYTVSREADTCTVVLSGELGMAARHTLLDVVSATVVDRAVSELAGLDVSVNNAAYQMAQPGGITEISTEQFDRVMKTHLYATRP
jgi:NAD(P)-dependent dehydrogenase (short-subunit alcohol dehydrogenase family)